jgi:hypothetical protein
MLIMLSLKTQDTELDYQKIVTVFGNKKIADMKEGYQP